MNVVPYDPLDLVEGMMKSVLRPSFESAFRGRNGLQGRTIPVDVAEDDRTYYVWADFPASARKRCRSRSWAISLR